MPFSLGFGYHIFQIVLKCGVAADFVFLWCIMYFVVCFNFRNICNDLQTLIDHVAFIVLRILWIIFMSEISATT